MLRRLGIVSEPVTAYIRFEWLDAAKLIEASGVVRWLSRKNARLRCCRGNDYWMFDQRTVVFTHFSGDGHVLGHEITTDHGIVARYASAFEAAWALAIPHAEFTPT